MPFGVVAYMHYVYLMEDVDNMEVCFVDNGLGNAAGNSVSDRFLFAIRWGYYVHLATFIVMTLGGLSLCPLGTRCGNTTVTYVIWGILLFSFCILVVFWIIGLVIVPYVLLGPGG